MAIRINSQWDAELFKKEREEARQHINSAWDAKLFYETYGGHGQEGNWGSIDWKKMYSKNTGGVYYAYNPSTRIWNKISPTSFSSDSLSSALSGTLSLTSDSTGVLSQIGVVDGQKDADSDSKTKAEKDYIEVEFNTLVGEITLIPTKANMKIKTNTTINLLGVGKYLSGLYFVAEVKKSMSADGYSLSCSLYKNGFGSTLKSIQAENKPTTERPIEVDIKENVVSNHFKVGDKVKIVGDDAVYSNAHEGVKIPEWVKQKELVIDMLSEDNQRARLDPIWSWTYTKFLRMI